MQDNEITPLAQPLSFDADKYRRYLEEMTLTPEQESELLAVLWDIMSTMVDIGFGEHSVQRVMDSLIINASIEAEDPLELAHQPIKTNKAIFDDVASQENTHE